MGINKKCPKCGSTKVQLSSERSKHGCFWFILFGIYYIAWVFIKWTIGVAVLLCLDSWMYMIAKSQNKGYVFKAKGWFSGVKQIYYCHDCGNNFRG